MKKEKKRKPHPPHVPVMPRETMEIAERRELLICGVEGIEEYGNEAVCVKTAKGAVRILGTSLVLCWAGEKKLMLRGEIESISFLKKEKGGTHHGENS